jgi:hypothetical protein
MKHAKEYEALAKLTGLPNLATVNNPERLESLVAAANSTPGHSTPECPLRYKIAYREYTGAAAYRLEHPEAFEQPHASLAQRSAVRSPAEGAEPEALSAKPALPPSPPETAGFRTCVATFCPRRRRSRRDGANE